MSQEVASLLSSSRGASSYHQEDDVMWLWDGLLLLRIAGMVSIHRQSEAVKAEAEVPTASHLSQGAPYVHLSLRVTSIYAEQLLKRRSAVPTLFQRPKTKQPYPLPSLTQR